jgi:hypothetical protein
MKTILIILLTVFFQSMVAAENIPESQARYERYSAENTEAVVMQCTAERYVEDKTGGSCDHYLACPICSLGVNRSKAAEQALMNLLALKLDAESADSLRCMIRIRGKPFISQLQKLDAAQARKYCVTLLKKVATNADFSKVAPEQVCNTEDTIRSVRDGYVDEIRAGKVCDPWNID